MGRDKNFIDHGGRVLVKAEWIEGGCWIGVEQRRPECIAVHLIANALSAVIFAIAEAAFPLPSFKVIAELTQVASQAGGKLKIVGRNFVSTQPCLQTRVMHPGCESGTRRRGADLGLRVFWVKPSRRRIVRDCERIERVLNRHANAFAAYS